MLRSKKAISAMMLAVALVAAACSGSSEPAAGSTAVAEESASAPDDTAADDTTASDTAPDDTAVNESVVNESVEGDDENADDADPHYLSGDAAFLFDPDVVHTFDIGLDPDALAELDADPAAEEYVEGSLTFAGETLERVGVRYKGSIGAFLGCTGGANPFVPSGPKTCTKLSFKLKINWDGADTEFYGQRRVQLHAMNLDESMLRDRLGYQMFRDAGVAAPRSTHARVKVNGEFVGLFALVEQVDGRFVRDRFADGSGNLYKEVWPFDESGAVVESAALVDGLKTNEDDDPSTDIIESFASELLDSGAPSDVDAARTVLAARTELDAFITYAVVDRAIRHDDGPFHWYCVAGPCEPHNFYLYEEPDTGKVHIIAWDLDNALRLNNPITDIADPWGETSNDCEPFPYGPLSLSQRSAACDPLVAAWSSLDAEFAEADAEFRSGPFAPENVRSLIDRWAAQIEPMVAEASAAHDDAPTVEEWRNAVDRLIEDFVVPAEQES